MVSGCLNRDLRRVYLMLVLSLACSYANAQGINNNGSGVALNGYDVVAYFENKAVLGTRSNQYTNEHGTFWFVNQKNRESFISNMERYLPVFSGYCAFGVRMGRKLPIDPESFVIHNDQLYMLLNRATQRMFLDDLERNVEIGHRLWPQVKHHPLEN